MKEDERGVVLVIVLGAILLLSTLGAALVLATTAESLIAAHFRTGIEALLAADAILTRGISDLRGVSDWSDALNGSRVSSFVDGPANATRRLPDGSAIDLVRLLNQLNCARDVACRASDMDAVTTERPWGPNNPRWRLFASGTLSALSGDPGSGPSLYVVALIADDGMESDGDPERDGGGLANPGLHIVQIRAEAFGPGGTRRAIQATVARDDTAGVDSGAFPPVRILARREVR